MDWPERVKEAFDLPQEILDYQEDAQAAEVWWHIFDIFGFETGVLEPVECRLLYQRYCHEKAHSDNDLRRTSACKAFAWYVRQYGGPELFGLRKSQIDEWIPTTEPFNYVQFEAEE